MPPAHQGKFITYESNAVRLNDKIFPAENITVGLNASLSNNLDINGDNIGYAPSGPLKGSVNFSFNLTGAMPSYMTKDGLSELPTFISFNRIGIYGYLSRVNYNIEPYKPIKVDVTFDFFHGIRFLTTKGQDLQKPDFDNTLRNYNGVHSYVFSSVNKLHDFYVTSANYSMTVSRVPYTKIGFESPSRVALEDAQVTLDVEANNIDDYMSIRGNDVNFQLILKVLETSTSQENATYQKDTDVVLNVGGKVTDQSFSIAKDSFGLARLKIIDKIPQKRNYIVLPFIENTSLFTYHTTREPEIIDFRSECPRIIPRQIPESTNEVDDGSDIEIYNYDTAFYTWYKVMQKATLYPLTFDNADMEDTLSDYVTNTRLAENFYSQGCGSLLRTPVEVVTHNRTIYPPIIGRLDLDAPPEVGEKVAGTIGVLSSSIAAIRGGDGDEIVGSSDLYLGERDSIVFCDEGSVCSSQVRISPENFCAGLAYAIGIKRTPNTACGGAVVCSTTANIVVYYVTLPKAGQETRYGGVGTIDNPFIIYAESNSGGKWYCEWIDCLTTTNNVCAIDQDSCYGVCYDDGGHAVNNCRKHDAFFPSQGCCPGQNCDGSPYYNYCN